MKQSQNNRVVPIVVLAFFQAVFFQMIASQLNAQESKEAEQPFPVAMTVALKLIADPVIQKELELEQKQKAKVNKLANQYRIELQTELMEVQALPAIREEDAKATLDELKEAQADKTREIDQQYTDKLKEVLLDFQYERLGQLGIQKLYAKPVFISVFRAKAVARQAKLTDSETDRLAKATRKAEEEYLAELRKLKLKYHQQVCESLSPDVKTIIEEILGEPYVAVPELKQGK